MSNELLTPACLMVAESSARDAQIKEGGEGNLE